MRFRTGEREIQPHEIRAWELQQARRALQVLKGSLTGEQMLGLLDPLLEESDRRFKRLASKSNGQWRPARIEVEFKGLSAGQYRQVLEAARRDAPTMLASAPEHYRWGPAAGEVTETFGEAPVRFFIEFAEASAAPIDLDPEFPVRAGSRSRLADGTLFLLGAHEFKDTAEGFVARLNFCFPSASPDDLIIAHERHVAVEFAIWAETFRQNAGLDLSPTMRTSEGEIDLHEVQAWELQQARRALGVLKGALTGKQMLHILAPLIEESKKRFSHLASESKGLFRPLEVELDVTGLSAGQFLQYLHRVGTDEAAVLAAHAEHYSLDIAEWFGVETIGGLPVLVHYKYLDHPKTPVPLDPSYPHRMVVSGQLPDGLEVLRAVHEFKDTADGFTAKLAIFLPSAVSEEFMIDQQKHLAVEFSNWIEMSRQDAASA